MAANNRRDFLKQGAKALLGAGALGVLSGGLAAGCDMTMETGAGALELTGGGGDLALHEGKFRQLSSFPELRDEFVAALDEVADGLLADPMAYSSFMEGTDAITYLRVWDRDAAILSQIVGDIDGSTRRGRLKRILTVSEMYDGALGLDEAAFGHDSVSSSSSSSSSSSISSGGDCATNGSATNGCCVIHTWGWSAGEGRCSILSPVETLPP